LDGRPVHYFAFVKQVFTKVSKNNFGKSPSLKKLLIFWQNFAPKKKREGMLIVIFNFLMATILKLINQRFWGSSWDSFVGCLFFPKWDWW